MNAGRIALVLIIIPIVLSITWGTAKSYEAALMVGERIAMKKEKEAQDKKIKSLTTYIRYVMGENNQFNKELLIKSARLERIK